MSRHAVALTDHTKFARRTTLNPYSGEYRRDFTQFDNDVIDLLASDEASAVTNSMLKIYARLHRALRQFQERDGVMWIRSGEDEGGNKLNAWQRLIAIVGVSNSTAKKALDWMNRQGIIHYEGYKNGYGIRIFFNRAKNSIGKRTAEAQNQKNLHAPAVPSVDARVPSVVTPFNRFVLDKDLDIKTGAPDGGSTVTEISSTDTAKPSVASTLTLIPAQTLAAESLSEQAVSVSTDHTQLDSSSSHPISHELVTAVATLVNQATRQHADRSITQAVSQAVARIRSEVVSETREWLDSKGIPKAVRVAMRESFDNRHKHDGALHLRAHAHEHASANQHSSHQSSTTQSDTENLALRDLQAAQDCFAAQIECVELSFDAGRTSAQIQAQFGFDECTWNRIIHTVNERSEISHSKIED